MAHGGVSGHSIGHSIAWPSINEPADVAGRVDQPAALVNGLFAREVGHTASVCVPVGGRPLRELIGTTNRELCWRLAQGPLQERVHPLGIGIRAFDPSIVDGYPYGPPLEEHDFPSAVRLPTEVVVVELPFAMLKDDGRRVIGFLDLHGTTAGRVATSAGIQQEL
jgi:hypothetical protein